MNSDFVIESSGRPCSRHDYLEFDGNIDLHTGGCTAPINVSHQAGTVKMYCVVTRITSVQVTITMHNSTTISFDVGNGCTVQLVVDSNQFSPPDTFQPYTVSLQIDSGVTNTTAIESC